LPQGVARDTPGPKDYYHVVFDAIIGVPDLMYDLSKVVADIVAVANLPNGL
jgi:hypothetical protein